MRVILLAFTLMLAACAKTPEPTAPNFEARSVCVVRGFPPPGVEFTFLRDVRAGKNTYGSVEEMVPRLTDRARHMGAHAIINFEGSQRFGFWPWRFVRPVVRGTLVKWDSPATVDCAAIGGKIY